MYFMYFMYFMYVSSGCFLFQCSFLINISEPVRYPTVPYSPIEEAIHKKKKWGKRFKKVLLVYLGIRFDLVGAALVAPVILGIGDQWPPVVVLYHGKICRNHYQEWIRNTGKYQIFGATSSTMKHLDTVTFTGIILPYCSWQAIYLKGTISRDGFGFWRHAWSLVSSRPK